MSTRKKTKIMHLPSTTDLIEDGVLAPFSTPAEDYLCNLCPGDVATKTFSIRSKEFVLALKHYYKQNYQTLLSGLQIESALDILEIAAYENRLPYNLANRVFCCEDGSIYYDLNADENTIVWIHDGKCDLAETPEMTFSRQKTYLNQVDPDFTTDPLQLPELIARHVNLADEKDILMLCIYLVTCFMGMQINHPLLICYGQKGASKSTMLRRIERIVDPKAIDLCSIPKSTESLEIRLFNSYLLTLDNVSYLKRDVSDLLARAVTGGTVTKRKLYENTEEVVMNIHSIVAINGISLVAKESDLLDRSILLNLERLSERHIRTEAELDQAFENDLPAILGCCFQLTAIACIDNKPVKTGKKTRMADFFDMAVKVGRALGNQDEDIASILWENQKKINYETLDENVIAQCLLQIIERHPSYSNSVSGLLGDIKSVAESNNISAQLLPKQPNILSRRLNEIKSNLEQEYRIFYKIVNAGEHKEIRIHKKKH